MFIIKLLPENFLVLPFIFYLMGNLLGNLLTANCIVGKHFKMSFGRFFLVTPMVFERDFFSQA